MHAHDRTLISRLGFADPDKKEPVHDLACQYLCEEATLLGIVEAATSGCNDRLAYAVTHVVPEYHITKGEGQYQTTIGFADLAVWYELLDRKGFMADRAADLKKAADDMLYKAGQKRTNEYYERKRPIRDAQHNKEMPIRERFTQEESAEQNRRGRKPAYEWETHMLHYRTDASSRLRKELKEVDRPYQEQMERLEKEQAEAQSSDEKSAADWVRSKMADEVAPRWTGSFWVDDATGQSVRSKTGIVLVEVKVNPVPIGDVMRQIALYRDHFKATVTFLVTSYDLCVEDVETLRSREIRHMRLGSKFHQYRETRRQITRMSDSAEI